MVGTRGYQTHGVRRTARVHVWLSDTSFQTYGGGTRGGCSVFLYVSGASFWTSDARLQAASACKGLVFCGVRAWRKTIGVGRGKVRRRRSEQGTRPSGMGEGKDLLLCGGVQDVLRDEAWDWQGLGSLQVMQATRGRHFCVRPVGECECWRVGRGMH